MIQRFSDFHPLVTFTYYISVISLLMLLLHPLFLAIAFFIILGVNYRQDRFSGLKRWGFLLISSGLLIIILNPLFNQRGRHILFEVMDKRITLEAVTYGGMTALSIMGVIAIFVSYNEVMTPNKLLFLFSKFLPQFALLLMLTLRFIPLMRRRLEEISAIQASKGISVVHASWKNKMKNGLLYVQALLTYSLEEAIQTADSMKARGYGQEQRSTYEHFRFRKIDACSFILIFILITSLTIGRFMGYGYLKIYPVMEPFQLSIFEILNLCLYSICLAFPLLVEGIVYVKWRLLN